jgi:hypothetical protein
MMTPVGVASHFISFRATWSLVLPKNPFALSENYRNGQQQKAVDKIGIKQLRINGNGPRGASIIGCEESLHRVAGRTVEYLFAFLAGAPKLL